MKYTSKFCECCDSVMTDEIIPIGAPKNVMDYAVCGACSLPIRSTASTHIEDRPQPPTPDEIRAARGSRSQTAAAALIGKPLRTWQNWEAPVESAEHRDMDPALFELFLLKIR